MSGNAQHTPDDGSKPGHHTGDTTIKVTVDSLAMRVKPSLIGSGHQLAGARIDVKTTAAVTLAGQLIPAGTEVLRGGIHLTQAGDLRVMATELLGNHVHDHLVLSGATASTIIADLQSALAPGGSPLMLVTDVLSALAVAPANSGHGHHG